jgi:hypothetical protein
MKQYVMLAAFLFHGGCSLQATLYWILSSQAQVDHHIKFLTLPLDLYRRLIILFKVFFFEFFSKKTKILLWFRIP